MDPVIVTPNKNKIGPLEKLPGIDTKGMVDAHFQRLGDDYRELILSFCEKIDKLDDNCELSFAVAAAADENSKNIFRTLMGTTAQSERKDKFEVVILANQLGQNSGTVKTTLGLIQEFQGNCPDVKVHPLYVAFDQEPTMGFVRSLVADVIAMRYLLRTHTNPDHYISTTDADNCGRSAYFVEDALALGAKSHARFISGNNLLSPYDCASSPLLLFNLLLKVSLSKWIKNNKHQNYYSGSADNSTFKLSSYCQVGGYPRERRTKEDMELKKRIRKYYKQQAKYPLVLGTNTFVYSGARRQLKAVQQGGIIDDLKIPDAQFKMSSPEIRGPRKHKLDDFFAELEDPDFSLKVSAILNMTFEHCRKLGILKASDFPSVVIDVGRENGFLPFSTASNGEYIIGQNEFLRNRLIQERMNLIDRWRYDTHLEFEEFFR